MKDSVAYRKSDTTLFTGLYVEYYFNNHKDIWIKQNYEAGLKDGSYYSFTQQGDSIEYGEYRNGLKNGNFFNFWDNGNVHHIEQYRKGEIVPPVIYFNGYGIQLSDTCDSIHEKAQVPPKYIKGEAGILEYISKELSPIMSDCQNQVGEILQKLSIVLTIDKYGKVINATFPQTNVPANCQQDLKRKLLNMSGWYPGQISGQPVCSKYNIPINCLLWK